MVPLGRNVPAYLAARKAQADPSVGTRIFMGRYRELTMFASCRWVGGLYVRWGAYKVSFFNQSKENALSIERKKSGDISFSDDEIPF
jgi:hypothetical protein